MATKGAKVACGLGLAAFGGVLYYTYKETVISKLRDKLPELVVDK